ncbi:MAG: RDD family protein [Candidatus Dormibacteraeota bacterium]|nr:RDD family protein [Candidatus Dormibacteraeota bacterium]
MQNYPPGYPQQPGYQPQAGQGHPQQPGYPQQPYAAASQGLQYGGFWIRFAAAIIDGLIVGVPLGIIYVVVVSIVTAGVASQATIDQNGQISSGAVGAVATAEVLMFAVIFVVSVLYFVILWARGATLGMRALKLQVVDAETGQQIGVGKSILRYIGYVVSGVPCYLGLMWAGWDSRKQGWHDKMAGTVVLQRM